MKELLKEWQNRLGLTDWTIELHDNVEPDDMALDGVSGCNSWTECNKTSIIQIIDPKFYGTRIKPFDYEETLVHELLHLKLCLLSHEGDDLQSRYVHQLIDDLARAFVDAKKNGGEDGDKQRKP